MEKDSEKHELLITRAEVARRQLDAAILMFFRDDDELAVHAVAQGAFQIIRDLLAKRDKEFLELTVTRGFFDILKAHANGQLRVPIGENLTRVIAQVPSDFLEAIRDRSFEDMQVTLGGYNPAAFWSSYKKQYNMLKHADKDHLDAVDPMSLDNIDVLALAMRGYVELGHTLSNYMETYYYYYCSLRPELCGVLLDFVARRVAALSQHEGQARREACRFIIGDPLLPEKE